MFQKEDGVHVKILPVSAAEHPLSELQQGLVRGSLQSLLSEEGHDLVGSTMLKGITGEA